MSSSRGPNAVTVPYRCRRGVTAGAGHRVGRGEMLLASRLLDYDPGQAIVSPGFSGLGDAATWRRQGPLR